MTIDTSKDYYAILGVLPSIEPSALKAVYLALLKKYHPDIYKGDKVEAERLTKEINEAYEVLSDANKRSEYDKKQKAKKFGNFDDQPEYRGKNTTDFDSEMDKDWKVLIRFYKEADERYKILENISPSLGETYKILLLIGKIGHHYDETFNFVLNEYLRRYFGENKVLQEYVLELIRSDEKHLLRDLNAVIRVLGPPSDDQVSNFIKQFEEEYSIRGSEFLEKSKNCTIYQFDGPIGGHIFKFINSSRIVLIWNDGLSEIATSFFELEKRYPFVTKRHEIYKSDKNYNILLFKNIVKIKNLLA